MPEGAEGKTSKTKKVSKGSSEPRSLAIAQRGITTGLEFASFMSALMSDLIEGNVKETVGNAACNAAGKLLKVVEMQMKYGTHQADGSKVLNLAMKQPLVGSELTQ